MLRRRSTVVGSKLQATKEAIADELPLDQDQEQKYNELIELLRVGGYFRVRINGLSRFDKIIGGLAWCITASNEDLDIDLFFQEEAQIGQRIKLGENIIRALQRMKCPYRLEPNQIQGGDYINIFPVVQWLVKKVIETREETGDLIRLYSEEQFHKRHQLPEDVEFEKRKESAISFAIQVDTRYKPIRKFRRHGRRFAYLNSHRPSEEVVQSTLLEYGEYFKYNRASSVSSSQSSSELERALGKGKKSKEQEEFEKYEKRTNDLQKEMLQVASSSKVNQNIVGSLLQSTDIQQMDFHSEDSEPIGLEGGDQVKRYGIRIHLQNVHKLEKEIAQQTQENKLLENENNEGEKRLEDIQAIYNKKSAYNQRIVQELRKLDALETDENTKQLQALRSLVTLNENFRSQEVKFKNSCKKQLSQLKEQIESTKQHLANSGKTPEEEAIMETFRQDQIKLAKVQQFLSKKNRDIALIERKLDEIPSRAELAQYQRQFVELYEQVSSKLTETRQYYNTYNTCEDIRSFLSKELSILNSIQETYKNAMHSKSSKDHFLESLSGIVSSIQQSLEKTEQKLNLEKETKNRLTEAYTALVEKERLYYKAAREFQDECRRNEELQAEL